MYRDHSIKIKGGPGGNADLRGHYKKIIAILISSLIEFKFKISLFFLPISGPCQCAPKNVCDAI